MFLRVSRTELERIEVIQRVVDRRLSQRQAAGILGVSARQVRRLVRRLTAEGPTGLVSKKRGKPSNNRIEDSAREQALAVVRERYHDFGPTLAHEKLVEHHGFAHSLTTLRQWMVEDGVWTPRAKRHRVHQPRNRRPCVGELVQIDGSDHEWFEERGPRCTLLVYVDDATSELKELQFVESETTFDYMKSTRRYLEEYGKPVAFYSDKHSILRVLKRNSEGGDGLTQFGRALFELNIEIFCANTSQAKGRVERAHQTLQDRLVKEMRLRGISDMVAGNAFLPWFRQDYNKRFGKPPRSSHNSHRPLTEADDLDRVFTWQEHRKVTKNLTLRYKRALYLLPKDQTHLIGKRLCLYEAEDGTVTIRDGETVVPYAIHEKDSHVAQSAIVENKRLGAVLRLIQSQEAERDLEFLGRRDVTKRQAARLLEKARVARSR